MKGKVVKIGSATLVAGAIVGIPLTYYLLTTDDQPIASPQVTDPAPTVAVETDTVNAVIAIPPIVEVGTTDPVVAPEPMEPEPEPIVVPEPIEPELEPEPEPVSLRADSRNVNVGSVTGGLLNPLRSVYDVGEPGSAGVDVDRSTLRITEVVSGPINGAVEIVDDGKNLLYTPDFELTQGMSGVDEVRYGVVSDSEGVVKSVEGVISVNLESEHVGNNDSELSDLLRDNFGGNVAFSARGNFRFSDGVVSNDDLRLIEYLVDNGFSDDSVHVIMRIPEDLSPVRNVDDHSLRKLLAVEKGLYQNQAFVDSVHGINSWPEDYSGVMKRASFVIPSLIEVIEGNKTINYDKLHLDEVFEKLGGEYTGLFSRGQNYVPFYGHIHPSNITNPSFREIIANLHSLDAVLTPEEIQGNKDRNIRLFLSWFFTENGLRYYDTFYNPLTRFNENVINFSVLAVLDEFDYTLGKPLVDKSSDEINNLFDLLHDANIYNTDRERLNPLFFGESTTGGYGVVYGWENGFMSNGERTNVYNQARSIIGLNVDSVSDGVFSLMDWMNNNHRHAISRPYFPNIRGTVIKEVEALNSLPSNVFYPSVYNFIPREYGGIWFGSSVNYPGIVTSALRSLNVQSRQFNTNIDAEYFDLEVDVPPYNLGSIVIDGKTWLYNGNFAFVQDRTCGTLLPEENLTLEKLIEIRYALLDDNNGEPNDEFFYRNEEFCNLYDL